MKRIKTAAGLFRDVRPRAGLITTGLMFVLSFLGGAVGLLMAALYCLPIPVAILALVGMGERALPVFGGIGLMGGTAAAGMVAACLVEDALEKRRARQRRLTRRQPDPGPWGRCIVRQDKLRDSILQARNTGVIPRRWR